MKKIIFKYFIWGVAFLQDQETTSTCDIFVKWEAAPLKEISLQNIVSSVGCMQIWRRFLPDTSHCHIVWDVISAEFVRITQIVV